MPGEGCKRVEVGRIYSADHAAEAIRSAMKDYEEVYGGWASAPLVRPAREPHQHLELPLRQV